MVGVDNTKAGTVKPIKNYWSDSIEGVGENIMPEKGSEV